MKDLLKALAAKPVVYYPIFADVTGTVTSAILLQQIIYWWETMKCKEYYKDNKDFYKELRFGKREFENARKVLIEKGLIKYTIKGTPPKGNYAIDYDVLEEKFSSYFPQKGRLLSPKGKIDFPQKGNYSYTENTTENTQRVAISKDIAQEGSEQRQQEKRELHPLLGKQPLQRIVRFYSLLWWKRYETPYDANFGKLGSLFKPLLSKYSEFQIAALIVVMFRLGEGEDKAAQFLEQEMYPLSMIPNKVNQYRAYLENEEGVDFSDPDAIQSFAERASGPALAKAIEDKYITLP